MTDKVWTASSLNMGTLRLTRDDDNAILHVLQGYQYADSTGTVIEDLPTKTISINIAYSNLPDDVIACLLKVFTFVENAALVKEGMNTE